MFRKTSERTTSLREFCGVPSLPLLALDQESIDYVVDAEASVVSN